MALTGVAPLSQVPQPPSWRLPALAELHWKNFDQEWVLFESISGQTLCLDPLRAAVLMCFEGGQVLNELQVRHKLADEFGLGCEVHGQVLDIIEQYRRMDLLISVPANAAGRVDAC